MLETFCASLLGQMCPPGFRLFTHLKSSPTSISSPLSLDSSHSPGGIVTAGGFYLSSSEKKTILKREERNEAVVQAEQKRARVGTVLVKLNRVKARGIGNLRSASVRF